MNSEQMIINAATVIEFYARDHNSTCCLYIKEGIIVACASKDLPVVIPVGLQVSPWEQEHGLTNRRWQTIGTALFNLYNKEKACQAPPKP